ncbi:hypothetical protein EHYA_09567 [Embleya hyalina]|uniref:Uncharacterized protein n=1 Tax=Embleya hyalina TaxID=516124 RepID=A0A401Z4M1_9ACTN|nr:hypothetical protein EHYA_09567 [Embleya hyalina]
MAPERRRPARPVPASMSRCDDPPGSLTPRGFVLGPLAALRRDLVAWTPAPTVTTTSRPLPRAIPLSACRALLDLWPASGPDDESDAFVAADQATPLRHPGEAGGLVSPRHSGTMAAPDGTPLPPSTIGPGHDDPTAPTTAACREHGGAPAHASDPTARDRWPAPDVAPVSPAYTDEHTDWHRDFHDDPADHHAGGKNRRPSHAGSAHVDTSAPSTRDGGLRAAAGARETSVEVDPARRPFGQFGTPELTFAHDHPSHPGPRPVYGPAHCPQPDPGYSLPVDATRLDARTPAHSHTDATDLRGATTPNERRNDIRSLAQADTEHDDPRGPTAGPATPGRADDGPAEPLTRRHAHGTPPSLLSPDNALAPHADVWEPVGSSAVPPSEREAAGDPPTRHTCGAPPPPEYAVSTHPAHRAPGNTHTAHAESGESVGPSAVPRSEHETDGDPPTRHAHSTPPTEHPAPPRSAPYLPGNAPTAHAGSGEPIVSPAVPRRELDAVESATRRDSLAAPSSSAYPGYTIPLRPLATPTVPEGADHPGESAHRDARVALPPLGQSAPVHPGHPAAASRAATAREAPAAATLPQLRGPAPSRRHDSAHTTATGIDLPAHLGTSPSPIARHADPADPSPRTNPVGTPHDPLTRHQAPPGTHARVRPAFDARHHRTRPDDHSPAAGTQPAAHLPGAGRLGRPIDRPPATAVPLSPPPADPMPHSPTPTSAVATPARPATPHVATPTTAAAAPASSPPADAAALAHEIARHHTEIVARAVHGLSAPRRHPVPAGLTPFRSRAEEPR